MSATIIDNFSQFLDNYEKAQKLGLTLACEVAEGKAKVDVYHGGRCPKVTGRLQNSITYAVEGKTGYVGSNVEYAPIQEAIHGFLQHSVSDHKDEIAAALKKGFDQIF